ncbi:hypothetical protein Tco_0248989, partial [Tanacetum coccineum]
METIHVTFDDLIAMASKPYSSGSGPQLMAPGILSSGLQMFDEFFNPPPSVVSPVLTIVARRPANLTGSHVSNQEQEQSTVISKSVEEPLQSAQFKSTSFQDTPLEESYSNVQS